MKRNLNRIFCLLLSPVVLLSASYGQAEDQADLEALELVREVIRADRQVVVAQSLQLTEGEQQAFWPLYHQYRAEMDKVADGIVKLVREYAVSYPDVPEARAKAMLKDLNGLEKKKLAIRASFLKKFSKVIPAAKTLRFAQVENRLDLAVQFQLAKGVPLVPIEGHLRGTMSSASLTAEGAPGGTVVEVYELSATVVAINQAGRKVTLLSDDGIKQTVKVGPEAINLDQLRVGDQLQLTVAKEVIAYLAEAGAPQTDSGAGVVALAPKGAKPGGIVADTVQVTARVTAIDLKAHKATLQFADGSTRTVAVRPDVDLTQRRVGEKVVVRITEMVALNVKKKS